MGFDAYGNYTPDEEDSSLIRPSDVNEYAWGQPSPYQDKQVMATGFAAKAADNSAEASRAESNALEYLRASLQKSADVSPSQGLAAALLAAVPTLGGYLIGKSVGAPDIPAGVYGMDMSKYQTGANAGGAAGAALGNKVSGDFLGALDANQAQQNSVYEKMAALESAKATRLGTRADQYDLAGLNAQEQRARQEAGFQNEREMLPLKTASEVEVAKARQSPEALEIAKLRAEIALKEADRRQNNQDFNQGKSEVPGFYNVSNAKLNPTTVIEIGKKREGLSQVTQLLSQFAENPNSVVGQESAINAAVSGLLMNAERLRTGSGANFTNTEQSLISRAAPHIAAGDLFGWMQQELLGRDQQQFARDLINLHQKTSDYTLADTYGLLRQDVPNQYYPPNILKKWGLNDLSSTGVTGAAGTTGDTPVQTKVIGGRTYVKVPGGWKAQ